MALVGGAIAAVTFAAPAAQAATTPVSTVRLTGTDLDTGATAGPAATDTGTTHPGDHIRWVGHYANNTGADAQVNITDPIVDGQNYVAGSLATPPGLDPQSSTDGGTTWTAGAPPANANGVGATGTVLAQNTAEQSAALAVSTVNISTPGGDGYSVEGFGSSLYTVFHHNASGTREFCATLSNQVCDGWPGFSTYVDTTPGDAIGTGPVPANISSSINGSLIANGDLYWPVQSTVADANGNYALGMQCLDLTALVSCGFVQLDTTSVPNNGAALIGGDGIAASDGNYYYVDVNGNLVCFAPGSGNCGTVPVNGGAAVGHTTPNFTEVGTYGRYVYATFFNAAATETELTCYDTTAQAICNAAFPVTAGPPSPTGSEVVPVLGTDGSVIAGCAAHQGVCAAPDATAVTYPYTDHEFAFSTADGFGTGAAVGARYYTIVGGNTVGCFDFGAWNGTGTVPACAGFAGPTDAEGYTVRPLANLPGCFAANGNAAQIRTFNETTGGACTTASASVSVTPADFYCDGGSGHATSWSSLTLSGLDGSEFLNASVTLIGTDGQPVPGFENIVLSGGTTTVDLSQLPASGTTSSLTAQVNLAAVTNTPAVQNAHVVLAFDGDPMQVCFTTVVPSVPCATTTPVTNTLNAVTTAGNVTDAPAGNSSNTVTFTDVQPAAACALAVTKQASEPTADPGDTATYTVSVTNSGTADYLAANPATITDDLSGVLTDASYNDDAVATSGTVQFATPVLSWSGALAAGANVTITYSVTVNNPDPTGTHSLRNTVTSPDPSNCGTASPDASCSVTVPVSGYTVTKVARVSVAHPGRAARYTITVTNIGQVAYSAADPASFTDDLTDVLDDATYNGDATATRGTVSFSSPALLWTGALPIGAKARISYTVTANTPDAGNKELVNTATPTGRGGACGDGTLPKPSCDPVSVPVASFVVSKSESAQSVNPGGRVTYKITVTNTGKAAYTVTSPASFTDDLSGVLDDATYNGDASTGAVVDGTTLRWAGPLPVGGFVTITYSVTVHDPDGGDQRLHNAVTTPGDDANCAPASVDPRCFANAAVVVAQPVTGPSSGGGGIVAETGTDSAALLFYAALALGLGLLLLLLGGRRRSVPAGPGAPWGPAGGRRAGRARVNGPTLGSHQLGLARFVALIAPAPDRAPRANSRRGRSRLARELSALRRTAVRPAGLSPPGWA